MPSVWIIAGLILLGYAWNLFLQILDIRSESRPVPDNVADVYDAETYKKWKAYHAEKVRLSVFSEIAGTVVTLAVMCSGLLPLVSSVTENVFLQALLVTAVMVLSSTLAGVGFEWYSVMKIEEKYGFNRTGAKTFVADQIRNLLLSFVLLGGIIWFFTAINISLPPAAAIPVIVVAMAAFSYVGGMIGPLISRMFNKFRELEKGELRDKLTALLEKHGYKVRAIQVMDASRRTTKANAYFTGLGRMKKIVLYDTLLEQLTPDQICAVFAHEMGHGMHHDIAWMQLRGALMMALLGLAAYGLALVPEIYTGLGFAGVNYGMAIFILINCVMPVLSPLTGIVSSTLSRKAEYAADRQAQEEGYADELIEGLKTLTRESLSNLSPHPWTVALTYSHPTLSMRAAALEARKKEGGKENSEEQETKDNG